MTGSVATTMWSRAALAVLAVGLAAGCTSTSEGSPSPETTETIPVSPPTTSIEETPEFPPRPFDIPLDDVNPCEVWTADQLAELGLRGEPAPGDPSANLLGQPTCGYYTPRDVETEHLYTATVAVGTDLVDVFGDDSRSVTETVTEVAGFPAIQEARPRGARDACYFWLGLADSQVLGVGFNILPNELTADEACELNRAAAEMAIETLRDPE